MMNSSTISSEHSGEVLTTRRTSRSTRGLTAILVTYQRLRAGRVAPCRFYPSCSQYALEAVQVHGAVRGGALALRRLSRCRPLGPHGVDLVPEPKKIRSFR